MNQRILGLTVAQLKKAIVVRERIEALEAELAAILGAPTEAAPAAAKPKRQMSAAARAKIAAAQKARWAKQKRGAKVAPAAAPAAKPQPKRKISAAGRKRIAAATKARWAKVKAEGQTKL